MRMVKTRVEFHYDADSDDAATIIDAVNALIRLPGVVNERMSWRRDVNEPILWDVQVPTDNVAEDAKVEAFITEHERLHQIYREANERLHRDMQKYRETQEAHRGEMG